MNKRESKGGVCRMKQNEGARNHLLRPRGCAEKVGRHKTQHKTPNHLEASRLSSGALCIGPTLINAAAAAPAFRGRHATRGLTGGP